MRLSPVDIRQQQFTVKMLRGFDRHEVSTFLEDVSEDYESALRELTSLREQLGSHEERARGIADTERTLKDTLVTTQRVAEEMRESARREAELIVREAALSGEKVMEEARSEEAKLRTEIQSLKRVRRQLIEEMRELVQRYDRTLSADLGEPGLDGERR